VGFRFTAQRLAEEFPVAGHVRNLANGAVELWAEGEEDQVRAFLDAVGRRLAGYIEEQTVRDEQPQNLRGFTIRY
jgi:acylphosphatase